MAAGADDRRRTPFFHSERNNVFRDPDRGRRRRGGTVPRGMPRDFRQSRGGGGWNVSRVHDRRR